MITLQTHSEVSYLREMFQSVHSKFLDTLDHLQNHPAEVKDSETAIPWSQPIGTIQNEESFLNGQNNYFHLWKW